MYRKFTSDISRMGPVLTPYVLEITDEFVIFTKRNKNLFNKDRMTIDIKNIGATRINTSILGTTLIISSIGGEDIVIKKMNLKDAQEAESIINKLKYVK